ncbi:MAG: hypothetical protein U1E76_01205 [Planctomycetota bacterium]
MILISVMCLPLNQGRLARAPRGAQGNVLVKLDKLRADKVVPSREQFASQIEALEQLAVAPLPANADVVIGALLFEASLLGRQLGDTDGAVRCYDRLLALADLDAYSRSHALIEKATLLGRAHRVAELESLVNAYAAATDHDAELHKHLAAILRRSRLMPGATFPAATGTDLAGKPFATPIPGVRAAVVAFVRARDAHDLDELRVIEAAVAKTADVRRLVVSVDLDPKAVVKAYQGRDAAGVVWQQGDTSLSALCGVLETPAFFVLDAAGKIITEADQGATVVAALTRPATGGRG